MFFFFFFLSLLLLIAANRMCIVNVWYLRSVRVACRRYRSDFLCFFVGPRLPSLRRSAHRPPGRNNTVALPLRSIPCPPLTMPPGVPVCCEACSFVLHHNKAHRSIDFAPCFELPPRGPRNGCCRGFAM